MKILPLALFALAASGVGCKATNPQQAFRTPDEAGTALVAALQPYDPARLDAILGPDARSSVASGDTVSDREAVEAFVRAYERKHATVSAEDGSATIVVGDSDWPLPIPLVKSDDGWRFDVDAAKDEILARRIGRNELRAIEVCRAIVDAQREYAELDPMGDGIGGYASKFLSEPGKRNGLYWKANPGEPESPLGPLFGEAMGEGYELSSGPAGIGSSYHGYRYRILTGQGPSAAGGAKNYLMRGRLTGGFAVLASPAKYGNSGITTFIVKGDGIVYEADLGADTERAAKAIAAFDPDARWEVAR